MTQALNLSRRTVLQGSAAAGAFALGFHMPDEAMAQGMAPEVNAWVVIRPDDQVVIRIARSEMGQGTLTGLAQMVAEELECDWTKVSTEYPTPGENLKRNRVWRNFSTGGSRGIRESHDYVRKGGAAARIMLIQAAANRWNVPVGECRAEKSLVTHVPSSRTLRYGELVADAAKVTAPENPPLKDPKDWKIIGKPVARLDTADKVDGRMLYASDIRLPGMLVATIRDCPVFGGKVKSFDAGAAAKLKGVKKILQVGETAVAVVAENFWQAKTALDAVTIVWDEGPNAGVNQDAINAMLKAGLDAPEGFVGNRAGDVKAALDGAAKKVEAVYAYPFLNHATMEPMNATALWTPDKCEVWCPTQNGEAALAATQAASGLPIAKCEVYKYNLGGGFGRRGMSDYVGQAVRIAKEMPGTPVKLQWTREEDMLHGRYHPITQCKLVGALDKDGNLAGLHMRISGQSILAGIAPQNLQQGRDPVVFQGLNPQGPEAQFGYTVPNLLIDHAMRNPPVPPGFWRGVNLNQNAIYVECFMDELAAAAGVDALEFRRRLMKNHPKHLAVLEAAAKGIGWGTPAPAGVHRGLAQTHGFGSYVAAGAEVSVTPSGQLKIHRIVAATDPGHAVNPKQIEMQVEGSFVYGLGAMLHQECTVKAGRIEQDNFDSFPSMKMDEMPKVETIVMPSGGFWGGVGEPTIAVAAPAVLNALARATGRRFRTFPLKHHDLKPA